MLSEVIKFNKVMFVTGYTDLKRGIDGLASIVYESFGQTPFEPRILFCSVDAEWIE